MSTRYAFHLQREHFGSQWGLRFAVIHDNNIVEEAQPIVMVRRDQSTSIPDTPQPMMAFDGFHSEGEEALQSLMDELWRNGIRPSDIGTPGHLAATKSHLNDMRAIVAKTLEVELK